MGCMIIKICYFNITLTIFLFWIQNNVNAMHHGYGASELYVRRRYSYTHLVEFAASKKQIL